jgi:Tfp pilus assembly protein PilX
MDLTPAERKRKWFREMRRNTMPSAKLNSRGFTLIAALLLTLLLSGFSIALLMMVNTEQRAGGADLSNNYTYRAAEGAMEKMTSDLANTFQNIQAPTAAEICAVSNNPPTWDPTVTFTGTDGAYNVTPVNPGVANPCLAALNPVWGPIQSGPDAGLYAQIIPVAMNVTAQRILGNSETVSMSRTAEVALIPVFQFGVFSDSDLFFGRSPNLGFAGRVHTNGDLYLGVADGDNLVFGDKISAFGNVIREQMDNGVVSAGNDNGGTVMIPTQSGGCNAQLTNLGTATPSPTCVDISTAGGGVLGANNGSVTGGHASPQVGANWYNVSASAYNWYIIDGNGSLGPPPTDGPFNTGASDLTLPFVNGTTQAFQIIRRPLTTTAPSSLLGGSQLAYLAQIRILLSDTQAGLHLEDWNGNTANDFQLVSDLPTALAALPQGATAGGSQVGAIQVPAGGAHYYSFGESYCAGTAAIGASYAANRVCPNGNGGDSNFVVPPYYGPPSPWPPTAFPAAASFTTKNGQANGLEWPLVNGWLLVEAKWASDGQWHGVTKEWLQLGFARGLNVPTKPGFGCVSPATNTLTTAPGCNYLSDHANAILYFQVTKDSKLAGVPAAGPGTTDEPTIATYYDASAVAPQSQYNWYPVNFYETREGENYDANPGFAASTGTPNGIMNGVELDVGNLRNWLLGKTGATGTNVDFVAQNGYILYFSDRRGMNLAGATTALNQGEYGFEDTVNYVNAANNFAPNGALEPVNYNGVSPEDVNGNNVLDVYGVKGVGDAFGPNTTVDTDTLVPPSPYAQRLGAGERIPLTTIGLANRVTGARHALKLVDGSLGNLPTMPPGNATNNCTQTAANPTACGGFTVASENPVYLVGNYNSNCPVAVAATPNPCTPNNASFDLAWGGGAEPNHSAAAVIADAVTMLSNNWTDWGCLTLSATCSATIKSSSGSLVNSFNPSFQAVPAQTPNRIAVTSYYRLAVAGGKTIAFTNTAQNPEFAFGMDGGVHNFLRFLEDWGGVVAAGAQQSLFYKGSLVSLYWSTYATGTFKCCNLVYNPPDRQYVFDPLFALPQNLPPGTPMFRNVDNLSYRQNQVARTN